MPVDLLIPASFGKSSQTPTWCGSFDEEAATCIMSSQSQCKMEIDLRCSGLQLNLTNNDAQKKSFAVGNRLFANLYVSYNPFTVYSHQQLKEFLHSALFNRDEATTLTHKERPGDIGEDLTLGYPERAANSFSWFKVPQGYRSAMLVPYDALTMQLDMAAGIWHMTNKYAASAPHTGQSSVKVHEFLLS